MVGLGIVDDDDDWSDKVIRYNTRDSNVRTCPQKAGGEDDRDGSWPP